MRWILLLLFCTCATAIAESKYTERMYREAVDDGGTSPLYLLFTLHDNKTGRDRLVCTLGTGLIGAIHFEFRLDYDEAGRKRALEIALRQPGHRFSFKSRRALRTVEPRYTSEMLAAARERFAQMSHAQLRRFVDKEDVDELCHRTTKRPEWDDCQAATAYAILERGVLVGSADRTGLLYLQR